MSLPLRWLAVGAAAGLFAACPPSLKEGRAYRCTPGGDTAQCDPWLCRLDGYCHDPAVGEPLDCTADSDCGGGWFCGKDGTCHDPAAGEALACADDTDCGGGWFCGKDRTCHDPAEPAPLPCDSDAQCAGGWRCNTEGTCVDPGPPPGASGAVERLELVSPLLPPPSVVSASPFFQWDDGGVGQMTAMAEGSRAHVVTLGIAPGGNQNAYACVTTDFDVGAPVADLAIHWPLVAMTSDGGPSVVQASLDDGGSVELFRSSTSARFWPLPLTWPNDARQAMAVFHEGALRVLTRFDTDGGAVAWKEAVGERFVDAASTGLDPGTGNSLDIPLAVLTDGTPSNIVTFRPSNSGKPSSFPWRLDRVPNIGSYTPVRLRASAAGFGIAFSFSRQGVREPTPSLAVGAWDLSEELPQPAVDAGTDGGIDGGAAAPIFVAKPQSACLAEESLVDFSISERLPTDTLPVHVETVCVDRQTGVLHVHQDLSLTPLQEREPGLVDGRTTDIHVAVSKRGHLALGPSLVEPLELTLAFQPDTLGVLWNRPTAATGPNLYLPTAAGVTLSLSQSDLANGVERIVEGRLEAALYKQGYVLADLDGGGLDEPVFIANGSRTGSASAGAWLFDDVAGNQVLVAAQGDAVFAGGRDGGLGSAAPVTRPAPGFDLSDLDVTRTTDAGVFEAWAVANARVFRLVARTVDRWSSSELPLSNAEPLAVWYEGARGRLVTTTGVVLSLPERVPLSEPLGDGVSSVVGLCGTALAVRDGQLLQLGPTPDGGLLRWTPVDDTAFVATGDGGFSPHPRPRDAEAGRLYRSKGRAFFASFTGMVYELHLTGCPP